MTAMHLFDDGLATISPLTDLRPSFDVRTAALTQLERFKMLFGRMPEALHVPAGLEALTREVHGGSVNPAVAPEAEVLVVNGRWPLLGEAGMVERLGVGEAIVDPGTEGVAAARVKGSQVRAVIAGDRAGLRCTPAASRCLLSRPWHVRTLRDATLAQDLGLLLKSTETDQGFKKISSMHSGGAISPFATVHPSVIFDSEKGPIFIDDYAVIRAGAVVVGPVYIGEHSTVLERAVVKSGTAIGPHCKVAGEVGGTIFQGFANKAHDGHLGDSWIGEWANLGAGTTNSNLLNTYGEVVCRATPESPLERTGEQFLGCVVGDHVKFAICTRIMTGAVVHTGTMWAAANAVSGCVGRFTWATDEGKRQFRLDKFTEIAKAVMARRKITPGAGYLARVAALHGAVGAS